MMQAVVWPDRFSLAILSRPCAYTSYINACLVERLAP